jgi:hypothetical protein
MNKTEILIKLENIIWLMNEIENTYVRNELQLVADALAKEWQESDTYYEEIKQILNYDETMENLNNIQIWKK